MRWTRKIVGPSKPVARFRPFLRLAAPLLLLIATSDPVAADSIPAELLDSGKMWSFSEPWQYRSGDDPSWALPDFDDSDWNRATTAYRPTEPAWIAWDGVGWFRHRFTIEESLIGVPLALWTRHAGSLQVFVDGQKIEPARRDLVLDGGTEHVVVVRYENPNVGTFHRAGFPAGFIVEVSDSGPVRVLDRHLRLITGLQFFLTALPLAFAIVHLALFFHMPTNRGNLVYAVLLILWSATIFFDYQAAMAPNWSGQLINLRIQRLVSAPRDMVLLALFYTVLTSALPRRFWVFVAASALAGAMAGLKPETNQWALIVVGLVILGEVFRIAVTALRRGHRDASLFAVGIAALVGFGSYDVLLDLELMAPIAGIYNAYYVGYLVFFVCMSIFLARDFSHAHQRIFEQQHAARDREREMERLAADNRRKTQELEEARELQLAMLPATVPELPLLAIAATMETATEVGGDYYDFHVDRHGLLTVVIGDATGHGMRAGTLVAAVKSFFSAVGGTLAPAQFLQRCSKLIQNLNLGRLHMAMLVIRIEGRTVRTATAGFPPALLFRANNGSVDELAAGGLPLGTRLDPAYEETELELAPGDTLLLASDGLAELLDPNGAPLDYTGVINAFKSAATLTPTEIVSSILAAADSWRDGVPQEDDITCVALQSTP